MGLAQAEGDFIKHTSCPRCGGSDPVALYRKEIDGEDVVDGYCWSCDTFIPPDEVDMDAGEKMDNFSKEEFEQYEHRGWKARRVGKPVTEFYGVRAEVDEEGNAIKRFYPVTKDGVVTGYKIRNCVNKDFSVVGKVKNTNEMFGQSLFAAGGKFLVICGGEEDAMSLQQAMWKKNSKYTTAIVSPVNGEQSAAKQIKANYEWVTSFEKVVLMLDNDEAGKKATEEALKTMKPGQAYLAKLNLKDPNEYIMAHREDELVAAFWKAERYSPIDLMTLGQMWDEFENSATQSIIPFPKQFSQLNEMLGGGVAVGEVTVIGALTSAGKSTMINNLVYSFFTETDNKIGLLYLESTPREIVSQLLSIHMEENLSLKNPKELNMGKLKEEFMEMVKTDDRIVSINHQGAFASTEELFNKVEWMVKSMGTSIVVVDPIQAAVPSNENSQIDEFMDNVLKLAKQTDASIFVVSHMRKPDGKDPHAVSEYELKGSSSINQIAFNTILLSRDKTAEEDDVRNATRLQVVKCRRTGFTGEAGWLHYDPHKAKLTPCENPYKESNEIELRFGEAQEVVAESF